jgi:hypothetical protein
MKRISQLVILFLLKNIFKEKELDETATTEEFSIVQSEGNREVTRKVSCYSLEAIIAVGYRVNSERGTQFRQWATTILQQYIHKGFNYSCFYSASALHQKHGLSSSKHSGVRSLFKGHGRAPSSKREC